VRAGAVRAGAVRAPLTNHLRALLKESLPAWRLAGSIRDADDGAILVSCGTHEITIAPAPSDLPFRWMVTIDDRKRGAISVIAVLRQVRTALDPGYATARARIAAAPLVPP
jgi:hypothetical protein